MYSNFGIKLLRYFSIILFALLVMSCKTIPTSSEHLKQIDVEATLDNLIPIPVSINKTGGIFVLSGGSNICIEPSNDETIFIGNYLADKINSMLQFNLPIIPDDKHLNKGNIYLTTKGGDSSLGQEGYELIINENSMTLKSYHPEGLFRGIQSIIQILYSSIEHTLDSASTLKIPTCTIRDSPRFPWRGVMLDVARHFFSVDDVKKVIDMIAYYKLNRFHIHLTNDQGWRIQINSWPNLAIHGGSTQVGGGPGGYYTQQDYSKIVDYANDRYIIVVPEIDMPGHTNAAVSSYPVLNCDGITPASYIGVDVGFSSLCIDKDSTYIFVDDVIRELSSITKGPYLHIGGDEALATDIADYIDFVEKVQRIVHSHGKQLIGWEEIAQSRLEENSIVQLWKNSNMVQNAVGQKAKLISSPSSKIYLDMKYDSSTLLGQDWAGYIEVSDAYNWDPLTFISGVTEYNILGVEAPLWTETVSNLEEIEFMLFPRLPGVAEIGWSPVELRNWEEYKLRLAGHGFHWKKMGVNFYRSPEIDWE
jgi:hexosaminidase